MNLPQRQFSIVLITFCKKFHRQIDIFGTGNYTHMYTCVQSCMGRWLLSSEVLSFKVVLIMIINYNDSQLN